MLLDSYWAASGSPILCVANEAIIAAMCSGRGMINGGCMCKAVSLLSVCQELQEQYLFHPSCPKDVAADSPTPNADSALFK